MFDVFIWDMGGHEDNVQKISSELPHARIIRYLGTHLDMLRRTATRSRTEYFWVISSCCDYAKFDFSWMPPVGQETQLHCWATQDEKFGDTFLVHLPSWLAQQGVEKLEWYQHVNYHPDGVPALPWPLIQIIGNDLAAAVKDNDSQALYTAYAVDNNASPRIGFNKWAEKPVVAFNKTGHVSLCPRDAKAAIKTQIYDWPYIQYLNDTNMAQKTQDVVFISYDEENAEQNWSRLRSLCPRAKRVHGVQGLMPALKAAAAASDTPYFYAVFGKTEILEDFSFDYQPDYLRRPANYIFLAYNPILDHAYGHGSVIMHDRDWLLSLESYDIDVTMSHDTVTIPIVSCINKASDAWSAWRTAYREAYKLKTLLERRYSIEDEYHLHLWLNSDKTEVGYWSKIGATEGASSDIDINDWYALKIKFLDSQSQKSIG
jgi:hypothetical protein